MKDVPAQAKPNVFDLSDGSFNAKVFDRITALEAKLGDALKKLKEAEAKLDWYTTSLEKGSLPYWQAKHDDMALQWFKADAACAEMRLQIQIRHGWMPHNPAKCKTCHSLSSSAGVNFLALKNAAEETLQENGHLADGDNCTLIKLKRAIAAFGPQQNKP